MGPGNCVCYIRYLVISVVNKQYKTKEIISLGPEKTVCYIRYVVLSDLFISSFHCSCTCHPLLFSPGLFDLASYHLPLWLLHLLWLVRLQSFPGGVDAFAPAPLWLSVGELWSHGARGNATWTHITPDDTSSCILHLGKNSVVCALLLLCSELVRCWQVICCDGYLGGCNWKVSKKNFSSQRRYPGLFFALGLIWTCLVLASHLLLLILWLL